MRLQLYEVVVGNVGTVLRATVKRQAKQTYNEYVRISKLNVGRAGGESVTLFQTDSVSARTEVIAEYQGTNGEYDA